MKGAGSKTSGGLSDFESSFSGRPDSDRILANEPDSPIDFGELGSRDRMIARLRLLWEQRRFLGRVAGFALLFFSGVALLIPNRYQSIARLMPPDNQSSSGLAMAAMALGGGSLEGPSSGGSGGLGGIASQLLGLKSTSDLLVGVLNSRTVADSLIHRFDLQKVYRDRRMEDTRKQLAENTDTAVDRKSQIISIIVSDKDPHRARDMAQAYVEELNRLMAEVSTSSARRERIFLEGRLGTVNQELESAEKEFSQFASENSTIDLKEQGKAMVEAAATLQGQLIAARSELEGLRQVYADSNVRVRSMQARIGELESQIRKVGGQDDNAPRPPGSKSDSLYPSIRKLPLLGVTYADLYRKTKVEEAVFQMLTQEYEMAKVQEAKEIPSVKVLDAPNVPDKKSFPPRTLIVLMGTVFALACGMAWLYGSSSWKAVDPADPGKILAQEVMESVKAALPWHSRNGLAKTPMPEAEAPASKEVERRQKREQ